MGYNSTLKVKKRQLACGHFDYPFSKNRCTQCSKVDGFNKRQEKEIQSTEGLPDVIADLDAIFSTYVRLKYADKYGMVKCYTCPTVFHYLKIQNGHYISRSHLYLRWDLRNCKPQCVACNCVKHGMSITFAEHLEEDNAGITNILYEEKQIIFKPTVTELKAQISEYSEKVFELKAKLIPV